MKTKELEIQAKKVFLNKRNKDVRPPKYDPSPKLYFKGA